MLPLPYCICPQLSEVGGELAEERAAAGLATERADAEAAERLRIEKDNRDLLANNQRLQQVGSIPTLRIIVLFNQSKTRIFSLNAATYKGSNIRVEQPPPD